MAKILIVDDDKDIRELLNEVLKTNGYETTTMSNGTDTLNDLKINTYDLILLDIMLPDISGIEIVEKVRNEVSCPIIFISAKSSLDDKLLGFKQGGDDYITKPFIIEELLARVNAHIRRETRQNKIPNNIIKVGDIEINKENYEVKKKGKLVTLSTKEFELLSYLMTNKGQVLSKEQIYNSVWKTEYGDIGTVAVNIKSLRKKLDQEEKYIITIWGLGYKFVRDIEND